jgi:hypothetical protein
MKAHSRRVEPGDENAEALRVSEPFEPSRSAPDRGGESLDPAAQTVKPNLGLVSNNSLFLALQ